MIPIIYVDAAVNPWRGKMWCHLFSLDLDALHAFAGRLGLRRSWFQCPPKASWPHYDTVARRRAQALRMGAVAADRYTALEVAWTLQGELTDERKLKLAELRERTARIATGRRDG